MKIIYRGGYNKLDPESIKVSTIPEYTPLIQQLVLKGEKVAIVTLAKPDSYYNNQLSSIVDKVDVIDSTNVRQTNWSQYKLIILMGGDTPTLDKWLKKGKFKLDQLDKGVTIVGDSAGAMILGSYYYDADADRKKVSWYKGINPEVKTIILVHANNPKYTPPELFPIVENFAKEKGMKVIKLNENQSTSK